MEVNLRELSGNWKSGYVLHKHTLNSEFIGNNEFGHPQFETTRSDVGEALFQLKFRLDFTKVDPLADAFAAHIIPLFPALGFIVPMPPSKKRAKQPVTELCNSLGNKLGIPVFHNILTKTSLDVPLKDMVTKDKKVEALKGSFQLNDEINNDGCWNALLVDDLFDSGASMEAACQILAGYPKISNIYVAALTWK